MVEPVEGALLIVRLRAAGAGDLAKHPASTLTHTISSRPGAPVRCSSAAGKV